MLVTFISQCEKNAIKRTRRILDAFANRIGDNVWQTAITEDGLDTVKKLLKASATRSTAVSCHRVRTRQRTELVWVVGNRSKFNEQGIVAVNRTKRNILQSQWENNWQNLNVLLIVSTLSALLHDIGKSTIGFQHKLFHHSKLGDPYRHEWISLKLLVWLVKDCTTDNDVFERLQSLDHFLETHQPTLDDIKLPIEKSNFEQLPPITQWIAWLIVTHHRLPPLLAYYFDPKTLANHLASSARFHLPTAQYYKSCIKPFEYWVKNPTSIANLSDKQKDLFFSFDNLVLNSPDWQKQVKRYAKKAQNDSILQQLANDSLKEKKAIANPFLLMLSRLCVMVADHNYSSLTLSNRRVQGSADWKEKLVANTDRKTGKINQSLDEHLLGVARFTAEFCRSLSIIHEKLPRLIDHQPLMKNTANTAFAWQNNAFKLALSQSEHSQTQGFFGINMASTGCGKTLGNARIMYALANPKKGARLTIALGLRVLTLQTGLSFRQNLALDDSQLAILVGGLAQKQLFEINREENDNLSAKFGSESAEDLIDEYVDSDDYDSILDELHLDTVIQDSSARKLIGSPIVTCTIDHLMQASECKRGGKYIAPMLRLLSSDLIFDEPDDFDQNDMPALSRLVHLAGVFGSRVLLSSATLPPDMVAGLFQSYVAGRKIYNQQFGYSSPQPSCAWFDENHAVAVTCQTLTDFNQAHQKFIQKRCQFLQEQPVRKMAKVLPLSLDYQHEKQAIFYQNLASELLTFAHEFHQAHHVSHVINKQRKNISVGLIRMANIQPLMKIAQAMHQLQALESVAEKNVTDTHFYLCCYHSQQVLALRNRLETRLDSLLTRKNVSDSDFIARPDIAQAIANHPNVTNHVFIVLATPVAEVGRDHDYDWALVEPSSMRSIIQLAGRVWRHRSDKVATSPNIGIWQYNVRALTSKNGVVFSQPGFETDKNLLASHDINALIEPTILQKIDAVSRIQKAKILEPNKSLVDLEQHSMAELMNNDKLNVVNAYFQDEQTANRHHVHLSVLTPFRAGRANIEYIVRPTEDGIYVYQGESVKEYGLKHAPLAHSEVEPYQLATNSPLVDVWLASELEVVLAELGQKFPEYSANSVVMRFSNVALSEHKQGYYFDERFGCWKKDAK